MTAILDLNDASLSLWHAGARLHSPGFVWHDGTRYHFGLDAQATARKTPRAVNARFWWQLSTEPLVPAIGPARHSADLVWSHLSDLHGNGGTPERVMIAAPGSMTVNQLSLLLGIIGTLPFNVDAVVHRSAALAGDLTAETESHVELQLNQILVTPLSRGDGHIVAGESQPLPGQGLIALRDELATRIAALFVEQTRFDPHRSAASEQALHDALPTVLGEIAERGETRLTIDGYQARVTREQLEPVGQQLSRALAALVPGETPVLLDAQLADLPGLDLRGRSRIAAPATLLETLTNAAAQLQQPTDALTFQSRVPVTGAIPQTTVAPAPAAKAAAVPTHLLEGSHARAIRDGLVLDGGAELRVAPDSLTLVGDIAVDFLVNGQPARAGQPLEAGDTLSDGLGFLATLITVGSDPAP